MFCLGGGSAMFSKIFSSMFLRQIFISHSEDRKMEAENIATSLRGRGFRVFLDKDALAAGRSYDRQIEMAIKRSSALVFLISPQSLQPGRYTLTELGYAEKKWPSADKRVLPVIRMPIGPSDLPQIEPSDMPRYLRGVIILKPRGDLGAEVSSEIASWVAPRNYSKMLAMTAVVAIVVLGIYWIFLRSSDNYQDTITAPDSTEDSK
jgi:hypothetical protein